MKLLQVPQKRVRSVVIFEYLIQPAFRQMKIVCFTCGNVAKELRRFFYDDDVLEVGPMGPLAPRRWWTCGEIAAAWPDRFDATSGHLPEVMMRRIAGKLRKLPLELGRVNYVPTGSGETITCLRLAHPRKEFVAVYNVKGLRRETEYHPEAPLAARVLEEGRMVHL